MMGGGSATPAIPPNATRRIELDREPRTVFVWDDISSAAPLWFSSLDGIELLV